MPVGVWEYAPLVGYDYGINDAVPESNWRAPVDSNDHPTALEAEMPP